MGGESSGSFIPKQNPIKRSRKRVSRHVYLVTIISYVSLFAAVIASVGVFFYSSYTDRLLDDEIVALDSEINSFEEPEMFEVLEFENRLKNATHHFNTSASIHSLLEAVEESTVATVQIDSFTVSRVSDQQYDVQATMVTDTFDSTIFQRGVLERNDMIADVAVTNVTSEVSAALNQGDTISVQSPGNQSPDAVSFNAALLFDVASLPLEVESGNNVTNTNATVSETEGTDDDVNSEAGSSSVEADTEVTNSNI